MAGTPHVLIIDGYPEAHRDELTECGMSTAAELYAAMLRRLCPELSYDMIFPSDTGSALPSGVALSDYDGIAWTGCSLNVYDDDPRVHRQISLAREAFSKGIPSFGSCWAAQIAVVAAGGEVKPNPRGREMGLARKISLTPEGRGHSMYEGKASIFEGFISHIDEITQIQAGGVVLATNAFTQVQAISITHDKGTFWSVQYHPEYDLHAMARLIHCRADVLIEGGFFADQAAVDDYVDKMETLHIDPLRTDIAWQMGIDSDVMDPAIRQIEVKNWIERQLLPGMGRKR